MHRETPITKPRRSPFHVEYSIDRKSVPMTAKLWMYDESQTPHGLEHVETMTCKRL